MKWTDELPTAEGFYLFYGWRRPADMHKLNREKSTWRKQVYDAVPPHLDSASIGKSSTGSLIYVVHNDFAFDPKELVGMWCRIKESALPNVAHLVRLHPPEETKEK